MVAARLDFGPRRAAALPIAPAAALLAFIALPSVHANPHLLWSFAAAGGGLIVWAVVLAATRSNRPFSIDVQLRPQHYVQACAHTSIFLYWGWYWRPVYDHAYLIAAQLLFAYAFDMLLTWSRRETYPLGFGPFPIVFSTNLFLWFRDDWFYLQFLMLAVGFAAKALIRWHRDGRRVHVFNPSAFTLTAFSVAMLLTGTSDISWGQDIAVTQFYPPHMYLFLFLVALPGQLLFGVTTMTMSAVVTTWAWGLLYLALTGTYYFFDSYIPIAVFLGMHLLFTDPSTSPRTEGGRAIYGMLYGLSTVALYAWLGLAGLPTFYDKLLQVPLMNLSIIAIDRGIRARPLKNFDPGRLWPSLTGRPRHLAWVSLWVVVFGVMSAAGGVGDRHPGQWLPFWLQACQNKRPGACRHLAQMYDTYCKAGSDWSCRALASIGTEAAGDGSIEYAGGGLVRTTIGSAAREVPPTDELPILVRGSKGPLAGLSPEWLQARACELGWADLCGTVSAKR
jgi:hypothetical protein